MGAPTNPVEGSLPDNDKAPSRRAGLYVFGVFEVEALSGELRRNGLKIKLQQKSFELLLLLIEHAGQVVSREKLRDRLWPADTFVDFDANIKTALNKLRHALGDAAKNPTFIETVPKAGFRFIAPVTAPAPLGATPGFVHSNPVLSSDVNYSLLADHRFWKFAIGLGLLFAGAVTAFLITRSHRAHANAQFANAHSVLLVLPFENLSGESTQEFFTDGVTDEMITLLGREAPHELTVVARTSAMSYRGTRKPISQIARELGGVDYALEGSVRRSGTHVAINTQLCRVSDQKILWAQTYERELDDLLVLQRDIAERVSYSLLQKLVSSPGLIQARAVDARAHDAYLMGLYYQENKRSGEDQLKSLDYYKEAIQRDNTYAPAYAGLAYSYMLAAGWELMKPGDAYPKARLAAERALQLDPNLAEAHMTLATVEHEYDWKWQEAELEFRRALDLNPNSSLVHKGYAEFLMHSGRNGEALDEIQKAVALDPLDLGIRLMKAFIYLFSGEYDKSSRECKALIEADSQFAGAYYLLGGVYEEQGRYDDAVAEFEAARKVSHDSPKMTAELARAYALSGRRQDAYRLISALQKQSKSRYASPYSLAKAYSGLTNKQRAFTLLHQAMVERSSDLMYLRHDPGLENLHDDVRFSEIIQSIGFPAERESVSSKPNS